MNVPTCPSPVPLPWRRCALFLLAVSGGLLSLAAGEPGKRAFEIAAGPAEATKKKVMIITGIANLLILLTGVRMWQSLHGFAPMAWVIVKIVCWLGFAAFAGLAYRRREKVGTYSTVAVLLMTVIVAMAYFQPGK